MEDRTARHGAGRPDTGAAPPASSWCSRFLQNQQSASQRRRSESVTHCLVVHAQQGSAMQDCGAKEGHRVLPACPPDCLLDCLHIFRRWPALHILGSMLLLFFFFFTPSA